MNSKLGFHCVDEIKKVYEKNSLKENHLIFLHTTKTLNTFIEKRQQLQQTDSCRLQMRRFSWPFYTSRDPSLVLLEIFYISIPIPFHYINYKSGSNSLIISTEIVIESLYANKTKSRKQIWPLKSTVFYDFLPKYLNSSYYQYQGTAVYKTIIHA